MPENAELAKRWIDVLDGVEVPDFAESFAPKIKLWHCYEGQAVELDGALLGTMMPGDHDRFLALMPDYRYEDRRVLVDGEGFAVSGTMAGTLADGQKIDFPCCTVVTVEDGRIARIDAYTDKDHHLPLQKAMIELIGASMASPEPDQT
jgi:SnoaL-like domain